MEQPQVYLRMIGGFYWTGTECVVPLSMTEPGYFRHLKVIQLILKIILCSIGSQWSMNRMGLI